MAIRAEEIGSRQTHSLEPISRQVPTVVLRGKVVAEGNTVAWQAEFPEERNYEGLALVVPGYRGTSEAYEAFCQKLPQRGYSSLRYGAARKGNPTHPQRLHVETLKAIASDLDNRAAEIRRKVPNGASLDLDRQLLLPHSMGGLAAPGYASSRPGSVEAIVNLAAVGYHPMQADELLSGVLRGGFGSLVHEGLPAVRRGHVKVNPRLVLSSLYHAYSHPSQTLGEGVSCLTGNVLHTTKRLQEAGVAIGYIAFEHDILVPPHEETRQHVSEYEVMLGAGHLAPQCKPDEVAAEVISMHERLVDIF